MLQLYINMVICFPGFGASGLHSIHVPQLCKQKEDIFWVTANLDSPTLCLSKNIFAVFRVKLVLPEIGGSKNEISFALGFPWQYFFNFRICSLNHTRCVCVRVRDEREREKKRKGGGEQKDKWKGWRKQRGNPRETKRSRNKTVQIERELKQIIYLSGINMKAYRMERIWMTRQLISPNWFWLSVFELPACRGSVSRQTVISCDLKCCLISQTNIKPLSPLD